jgi:hypothetical protein
MANKNLRTNDPVKYINQLEKEACCANECSNAVVLDSEEFDFSVDPIVADVNVTVTVKGVAFGTLVVATTTIAAMLILLNSRYSTWGVFTVNSAGVLTFTLSDFKEGCNTTVSVALD